MRRRLKRSLTNDVIRPPKGKCPLCKAPENQYCKSTCQAIDGCDIAKR